MGADLVAGPDGIGSQPGEPPGCSILRNALRTVRRLTSAAGCIRIVNTDCIAAVSCVYAALPMNPNAMCACCQGEGTMNGTGYREIMSMAVGGIGTSRR